MQKDLRRVAAAAGSVAVRVAMQRGEPLDKRGGYNEITLLLAWRRRFFLALLLFLAFRFAAFRFARPAVGRGSSALWWSALHSVLRPAFLWVRSRRTSFGRRHSRLETFAVWRTGLSLRLPLLVNTWRLEAALW